MRVIEHFPLHVRQKVEEITQNIEVPSMPQPDFDFLISQSRKMETILQSMSERIEMMKSSIDSPEYDWLDSIPFIAEKEMIVYYTPRCKFSSLAPIFTHFYLRAPHGVLRSCNFHVRIFSNIPLIQCEIKEGHDFLDKVRLRWHLHHDSRLFDSSYLLRLCVSSAYSMEVNLPLHDLHPVLYLRVLPSKSIF